jgi:hypothetical protein
MCRKERQPQREARTRTVAAVSKSDGAAHHLREPDTNRESETARTNPRPRPLLRPAVTSEFRLQLLHRLTPQPRPPVAHLDLERQSAIKAGRQCYAVGLAVRRVLHCVAQTVHHYLRAAHTDEESDTHTVHTPRARTSKTVENELAGANITQNERGDGYACQYLSESQRIHHDAGRHIRRHIQRHRDRFVRLRARGQHRPDVRRCRPDPQPSEPQRLRVEHVIGNLYHDVDTVCERGGLERDCRGVERAGRELKHGAVHRVERVAELRRTRVVIDVLKRIRRRLQKASAAGKGPTGVEIVARARAATPNAYLVTDVRDARLVAL